MSCKPRCGPLGLLNVSETRHLGLGPFAATLLADLGAETLADGAPNRRIDNVAEFIVAGAVVQRLTHKSV
ncbi:MAG: hypothetical protein ACRDTV_10315 [Mycobacterium sp.]